MKDNKKRRFGKNDWIYWEGNEKDKPGKMSLTKKECKKDKKFFMIEDDEDDTPLIDFSHTEEEDNNE